MNGKKISAKTIQPATKQDPRAAVVKNTAPNKGFNQCGENRAGDNLIAATGRPAAAGVSPVTAPITRMLRLHPQLIRVGRAARNLTDFTTGLII